MVSAPVSDEDFVEARRRFLVGLANGRDAHEIVSAVFDLHPKNNTFPGEVFLELAADALAGAVEVGLGPVDYEGLLERFLPECEFRGKDIEKIRTAVLLSAARAGGLQPDLFDDVAYWATDDYWRYALLAAVALVRSVADAQSVDVQAVVRDLASRHGISIGNDSV